LKELTPGQSHAHLEINLFVPKHKNQFTWFHLRRN